MKTKEKALTSKTVTKTKPVTHTTDFVPKSSNARNCIESRYYRQTPPYFRFPDGDFYQIESQYQDTFFYGDFSDE